MSSPDLSKVERLALTSVLETNKLSIGPKIEEFEQEVSKYVGSKYAIGVNSGTSGLHLAVIAAGVKKGDFVITTPFSFISSANCILYAGGIPLFVDVDIKTGNIDPALVEEALFLLISGKNQRMINGFLPPKYRGIKFGREKIKAVLAVDVFGQPVDIDPILDVARQYGLTIIEDSCEAISAEYKGQKAGTLGDVGVFAFYPNKQMTTGEGGMIVTDRAEWDALFRSLRNQGRNEFNAWLNHSHLGYNYRLDEMSAALGVAQMSRIEELINKRKRVAKWYCERLEKNDKLQIPYISPTTTRMSWFVYVIQLGERINRNHVMTDLGKRGIPSRPYFPPIHLQPFYVKRFGNQRGSFPVAEKLGDICLALPFSGVMTKEEVNYVCENLVEVLREL